MNHSPQPQPRRDPARPPCSARLGSGRPAPRLLLLAAAALAFLAGCVEAPPPRAQIRPTGDPVVDDNAQLSVAPTQDRVMWEYRLAAASLRRGETGEAQANLDSAKATVAAALAGADPQGAAAARSTFHRESEKTYIGEPYERVMADYYRAILYWDAGQPDNARALFRDGEFIASDTVDKKYAGSWALPDYLDGLISARLGDDSSAALQRARAESAQRYPLPLPDYDPMANVLFFAEFGRGPRKFAEGKDGERLRFLVPASAAASARLDVQGQPSVALPAWDDVAYQAMTRGGRVMDYILANKAVFKEGAAAVGNLAFLGAIAASSEIYRQKSAVILGPNGRPTRVNETQKSQAAQDTTLALLAVGMASELLSHAAQPQADVRDWDNLPRYLSFAALRLPPGVHAATLTFYDSAGRLLPDRTQAFAIDVLGPDPAAPAGPPRPRDTLVFRSEVRN